MPSILDRLRNPGFNQGFNQGLYGATADPYANPLLEAIMGGNQGMAQWQEQQLQQQALVDKQRREDADRQRRMAAEAAAMAAQFGPELAGQIYGGQGLDPIMSMVAKQRETAEREKELAAAQELDRIRGIIEGGATGQPDLMGPPTRATAQQISATASMTPAQKSAYLVDFLRPPEPEMPGEFNGYVLMPDGTYKKKTQGPTLDNEPSLTPNELMATWRWAVKEAEGGTVPAEDIYRMAIERVTGQPAPPDLVPPPVEATLEGQKAAVSSLLVEPEPEPEAVPSWLARQLAKLEVHTAGKPLPSGAFGPDTVSRPFAPKVEVEATPRYEPEEFRSPVSDEDGSTEVDRLMKTLPPQARSRIEQWRAAGLSDTEILAKIQQLQAVASGG